MATTGIEDRPTLAPAVQSLLAALRGRIRWYVWLEGVGSGVAWLGAAFWASLGVDWFFEPSRPVRGAMLAVVGLVLCGVLVKMIGRRAFIALSDSNMATLLERRYAELDDSLLTAVFLTGRSPDPAQCNPRMLARTCREAADRVEDVRLAGVFNPVPLRRSFFAAVLLSASVLTFGLGCPRALGMWTQRCLLLSNELWPRNTKLEVEGFENGVEKVARGADFEVIAKADTRKQVPKTVQVRYRIEGGRRDRKPMNRLGVADPAKDRYQQYSYTFQGVLAPIRFDVVGGDDRVRDLRLEVVESPTVDEMALACDYPPYMSRSPRTLPVTGVMRVPQGTRLTVQCTANKDLVRVQIDSGRGERASEQTVLQGEDLAGGPRDFQYPLPSLDEKTWLQFTLSDSDGITGREPVRLELVPIPDEPPQLAARLRGIGPEITPNARLPAVGNVTDDYGIDKVWFEYTIDEQKPAERPIDSPQSNLTELPLDAVMEVDEMGLVPGQNLLVCVKAADRYDLGGAPNVGTSERWLLDVVTPDQLRARLEQRELVLRQRFERIIQEVTESRDLLLRVEFGSPQPDEPTADKADEEKGDPEAEPDDEPGDEEEALSPQRRLALRTMRVRRATENSRKNAHETLGVADAFDDIRLQLINNRIDTEELNIRLKQRIADPLREIGEKSFPDLETCLDELEAKLADEQAGPRLCGLAVQKTDLILLQMRRVLEQMLELETFNEAVEMLREIIKLQEQLHEQTKHRHKQELREHLED